MVCKETNICHHAQPQNMLLWGSQLPHNMRGKLGPFLEVKCLCLGEGLCEQWGKLSGGLVSGLQWEEGRNYSLVDYFSPWNTWVMILAKADGSAGQFIMCLLWMSFLNYFMDRFRLPHLLLVPASISFGFNARKNSHLNANLFSLLSPEVTKPPSNNEGGKKALKDKVQNIIFKNNSGCLAFVDIFREYVFTGTF